MSEKEFDRLQNRLDRPFGIWNCRHNWWPIILGVSQPTYSQEELDEFKRNSNEQITIDGVTKTRYQWTQEQRRLETAVRYQKDIAIAAKASNDDLLRRTTQRNINKLQANYEKISEKAGLIPDKSRMAVAGFRKVKTADELKNPAKYGIMNLKINANGEVVNPMNSERYNTIKVGMAKIGITIMEAKGDDLRYLRYGLGAEATYSHGYIMHIGKIPSASGLFEEIIHSTQARKYGELESTDIVELSAREVAANRMLLNHGKAYGFDEIDFEDIKNNLSFWEKRYRKETGYSYDDGNHNRQI